MTDNSTITITPGGPQRPEGQEPAPDGVYSMTLVTIHDPREVQAQKGPKAGQTIILRDWDFAIDDGGPYDGQVFQGSTSPASGPKSKMYAYLTALMGGKAPAIGTQFQIQSLLGRRVLVTIRTDEGGWPRIENLGAMPASMLAQGVAKATGAPLNEAAAAVDAVAPAALATQPTPEGQFTSPPAREAVAAPTGDLPF